MSAKSGQLYFGESGIATGSTHAAAGMRSQLGGQVVGSACATGWPSRLRTAAIAATLTAASTRVTHHPLSGHNTEQVGWRRTIVDMQLTHFGHSCLLASFPTDHGAETTVLFDPGVFSHGFEGITGLSAILITHQHPDHVDTSRLPALVDGNPDAALYADPQTAAQLGEPWQPVNVGDELTVGGLRVRGVGGVHAVIHPEIPLVNNISYLVGDAGHPARLMHPGDALYIPREPVDVLALPAAAPWMKISEGVEYLRAVNPNSAIPIHQGIVSPEAYGIYYQRYTEMGSAEFRVLAAESATEF